jgi:multisubunit Na+/H+ antiporter MnhE subunit
MPKTIFGTTERSNFILNMGSQTVQKWLLVAGFAAVFLPLLGGIAPSVTDKNYFIMSAGVYSAGFFSLLCFLIVTLRGDVKPFRNKGFWAIAFFVLWAFLSYSFTMANIYEGLASPARPSGIYTPLVGEYGRYEGLLSLVAYAGVFLAGMCISEKKTISRILNIIIAAGIFEAVWGILQHIPGLGFPNMYKDLPTFSYDNVYLASGTTDSPIFFGAFLTLSGGVAVMSAVFAETVKKRNICIFASSLMFLTGLFTSSITPLIGFGAIVVLGFIFAIAALKRNKNATPLKIIAVITLIFAVIFTIVFFTQGLWIRDVYIARFDDFYRKFIVGATTSGTGSLYKTAWGNSIAMIRDLPFFGVGPDCFAAYQNFAPMTYDKSYNEYLYTAATRGVPALLGYVILLILFTVKSKQKAAKTNDALTVIIFTAAAAYMIQAFWNASSITVAPIFYLLLGLGFADVKREKQRNKK